MGASTQLVLDLSQLRNITLGDEALMRELVSALVNDAAQQIGRLRQAMERLDPKECVRLAHGLKGACGNIGAASMADLFLQVERTAAAGNLKPCVRLLERLSSELEMLRAEADSI